MHLVSKKRVFLLNVYANGFMVHLQMCCILAVQCTVLCSAVQCLQQFPGLGKIVKITQKGRIYNSFFIINTVKKKEILDQDNLSRLELILGFWILLRVIILFFRTISQQLNYKTEFGPELDQFKQIRTNLRFLSPIQGCYSNFQNNFSTAETY